MGLKGLRRLLHFCPILGSPARRGYRGYFRETEEARNRLENWRKFAKISFTSVVIIADYAWLFLNKSLHFSIVFGDKEVLILLRQIIY